MNFLDALYQNLIYDERWLMILHGLLVTLIISVGATILALFLGALLTYFSMSTSKILRAIAYVYLDIVRGTPLLLQLLIINFTLFSHSKNAGILVGIVTLGISTSSYITEVLRTGILSIDVGQTEASRSLGLTKVQTMRYVVLPQAIKNVIPALVNEIIALIKDTSIVGYIAVEDLTKVSQIIMSRTMSVIPLFATAFIYFIIIKIMTIFLRKLENKLRTADNR